MVMNAVPNGVPMRNVSPRNLRGRGFLCACIAADSATGAALRVSSFFSSFFCTVALVSSTTFSREPVTYTVKPLQPNSHARKYALATSSSFAFSGKLHVLLIELSTKA